ncbi:thioesterase [Porphyromonas macacae]|uniref:Acyl-coenzyme A thioesterase THEM4 n=1 Tax=Porphyromonas macacae TaxID=28115 RepID=A0A0A2E8C6_9PORP|nr:hotdog domain-containing protein [Porphyromonas macacae]KGN75158.1 thioesterase [Porphyromonas macacae]KGN99662.1 thioesterase [Porphyromonas macacae]
MKEGQLSFQECYSKANSHCFGCGYSNHDGLHIKSYWSDEERQIAKACFVPDGKYTGGYPGFVYGGLIAAVLDCHGNGTAYAAGCKFFKVPLQSTDPFRYVTASLNIDFLRPTPMGCELELLAEVVEVTSKKVVMNLNVIANGTETVKCRMVSVLLRK